MSRCRIHIQATTSRDVANLIDLGWSYARWCDAHVEAYVVTANPVASLRVRLGRPQRGDLVVAEMPEDSVLAAGMVNMLRQSGHRALLLPPRSGPSDLLWGGWSPDATASPAANAEAALCAIVVEQHLRWRGGRPQGHRGDPITSNAIAAVFNGARPTWPRHRADVPVWRHAERLLLGTIGPDGPGTMHAHRSPGVRMGWIVIPHRCAVRMSDALDSGCITVVSGSSVPHHGNANTEDVRLRAHLDDDAVRFVLPGTDTAQHTGLTVEMRSASLLDPGLHQSWEMLRELLLMPRLRSDLLAASDPAQHRRVLMLDDEELVGAGAASTTDICAGQEEP